MGDLDRRRRLRDLEPGRFADDDFGRVPDLLLLPFFRVGLRCLGVLRLEPGSVVPAPLLVAAAPAPAPAPPPAPPPAPSLLAAAALGVVLPFDTIRGVATGLYTTGSDTLRALVLRAAGDVAVFKADGASLPHACSPELFGDAAAAAALSPPLLLLLLSWKCTPLPPLLLRVPPPLEAADGDAAMWTLE